MSPVDVDSLLQEISPDAPCGEDLSYDPTYTQMERTLNQGLSEGMVEDASAEQEGPNWREFRNLCVELLGRTKDLRVGVNLSLALLMEEGIPGFRDGLAVVRGLLQQYWDQVHPQLDPDDNNDPLERMNIIASLSPPAGAYMDPMMFCRRVRQAPLTRSARLGAFGLRDIEAAEGGEQAGEGETAVDPALVSAAFEDTATEDLTDMAQALDTAIEHVQGIEDVLTETVGAGQAVDLSGLRVESLGKARAALNGYLARRGLAQAPGETAGETGEMPAAGGQGATPLSGDIRSPQDVLAALEKVCQYYERSEPSSPVPMLVRRAQRLVSKNFLDIVRDLTPEFLDQVEKLGGIDNTA